MFWIAAIKKDAKGGLELKFHDRIKAVELLLKLRENKPPNDNISDFLKALNDSVEVENNED